MQIDFINSSRLVTNAQFHARLLPEHESNPMYDTLAHKGQASNKEKARYFDKTIDNYTNYSE
ncbi:MAG TPA: hypothetical protein DEV81_25415 [Cyanobacteria bacterium UBA11049]|nr:hypothetical protein [Cyanobacteria bacterium UBA11049]